MTRRKTPTYYGEADSWLTQTVSGHEADSRLRFTDDRRVEFDDLISQEVFSIAHIDQEIGHTIFNARFVEEIRHIGTPQAKLKSRFIVHAYKDMAQGILT